jgi:hypothetical protein
VLKHQLADHPTSPLETLLAISETDHHDLSLASLRLMSTLENSGSVWRFAAIFIRGAIIASLLAIFGYANAAWANSCSNVDSFSSYDESGLRESEFGISATGTFRIADEPDESKQPMFNLSMVNCEKQTDDMGTASSSLNVVGAKRRDI